MADRRSPSVTLALHPNGWNAVTVSAGITTDKDLAGALCVSRQTVNRVRNGRAAPGPEFIASAITAFPEATFAQMFTVVPKATA